MARIKAVLFDRDDTLSFREPGVVTAREAEIGRILGDPAYKWDDVQASEVFWRTLYASEMPIDTMAKEEAFWRAYMAAMLLENGFEGDPLPHSEDIVKRFSYHESLKCYDEVKDVLGALKKAGYLVGIISDTFPSLEASFKEMGLDEYVDSYTASMVVGCSKPDEAIFYHAVTELGVKAEECIFVDDLTENVDAAEGIGMIGLLIDREAGAHDLGKGMICDTTPVLGILGIGGDAE